MYHTHINGWQLFGGEATMTNQKNQKKALLN